MGNWTDEELIQVYDLQEKCTEKIVEFVRNGDENEVMKFLQTIPNLDEIYVNHKKEIFHKGEFVEKYGSENIPEGRYIYKDMENWKGADTLKEIFEEKYMWEFAEARPNTLALLAGNIEMALETYSIEQYEKLREEIPQKLLDKIKNLIVKYPKEIEEKAFEKAIYGYSNEIMSSALREYRNEHMPEFEKIQYLTQEQSANTIVGAYDLQAGLMIYSPNLDNNYLTGAIKSFCENRKVFELVYGEKMAEILRQADEKVLGLARKYDFIHTKEKLPVLENHKICLFGTAEQKMRIPYKKDIFCVSEKDLEIIIETVTEKYEREGFSRKYYPSGEKNQEYANQSYKVVGRYKTKEDDVELQPQWNIVFEDGKIITAKADEIISSAINDRFYGEQVENFGKRPLETILAVNNEKIKEEQKNLSSVR